MRSPEQQELSEFVRASQFQRWIKTDAGLKVKSEVIKRARQLRATGFVKYGIEGIWNAIRYDRDLTIGPDESGFKMSNNHKSFMSRLVENECPDLKGFFTMKRRGGIE